MHRLATCLGVGAAGLVAVAIVKPEAIGNAIDGLESIAHHEEQSANAKSCVQKCQLYSEQFRFKKNIPGLVIGVSVGGREVWTEGFGYSNIELSAKVHSDSVMRIASISKSITSILVAKLVEEGKLDWDKTVSQYLTEEQFPTKYWEGVKVEITLRQLMSHLGGIRHYMKPHKVEVPVENNVNSKKSVIRNEFESEEYYKTKKYDGVIDSLKIFKDDDLVHKPGSYLYTTYGWTLISAIVQTALPEGQKFGPYLVNDMCRKQFGMHATFLDENEPIIFNRTSYYVKSKSDPSVLLNAPAVENSYKWAGGGLLSSIPDLLKFGNIAMFSYLGGDRSANLPGYLRQKTVEELWTPVPGTSLGISKKYPREWGAYGMGWGVVRNIRPQHAQGAAPSFSLIAYHSGGAVGASSFMLIIPELEIVVAAFANLQNTGLGELCLEVAETFAGEIRKQQKAT